MQGVHHGRGDGHSPQPEALRSCKPATALKDAREPVLVDGRQSQAMFHGLLFIHTIGENDTQVHMRRLDRNVTPTMHVIPEHMLGLSVRRCQQAVLG